MPSQSQRKLASSFFFPLLLLPPPPAATRSSTISPTENFDGEYALVASGVGAAAGVGVRDRNDRCGCRSGGCFLLFAAFFLTLLETRRLRVERRTVMAGRRIGTMQLQLLAVEYRNTAGRDRFFACLAALLPCWCATIASGRASDQGNDGGGDCSDTVLCLSQRRGESIRPRSGAEAPERQIRLIFLR